MKSTVLIALLGATSAVRLGDVFDSDSDVDYLADKQKHNYFTDNYGKTYDLAQHGTLLDQSNVQIADNFDDGFEEINLGEKKKSHYFLGQNGKTYDLASGHRFDLRSENFVNEGAEYVQTSGDYFDRDLPEDAFKPIPEAPKKKAVAGKAGFIYDPVTGLPVLAGMSTDAEGQIDYDNLVQVSKDQAT
jgi:hypothetical protein